MGQKMHRLPPATDVFIFNQLKVSPPRVESVAKFDRGCGAEISVALAMLPALALLIVALTIYLRRE